MYIISMDIHIQAPISIWMWILRTGSNPRWVLGEVNTTGVWIAGPISKCVIPNRRVNNDPTKGAKQAGNSAIPLRRKEEIGKYPAVNLLYTNC